MTLTPEERSRILGESPYDNVVAIRKILPVVAAASDAASEECGYCGLTRDTAETDHVWDYDPVVTHNICERKHLQAIRDGYDKLDQSQIALASEPWPQAVNRLTAVDPNLKFVAEDLRCIEELLIHAKETLEKCTYFHPDWTYAQSKPQGIWQNRWTWRVIDWSAVGIIVAFITWLFVK